MLNMCIFYIFLIYSIYLLLDISLILIIFQISSLAVLGESFFVKISKNQNYLNYNF